MPFKTYCSESAIFDFLQQQFRLFADFCSKIEFRIYLSTQFPDTPYQTVFFNELYIILTDERNVNTQKPSFITSISQSKVMYIKMYESG